ncbi:MAG: lysophospholipid acyltransferase family protein [Candidatus Brocadiae bacterium]|nr:lysophospholipid acyltransferase family protein [Candidatus Brocadiia bacterium]
MPPRDATRDAPVRREDLPLLRRLWYYAQYVGPRFAASLLQGLNEPFRREIVRLTARLTSIVDLRHAPRAMEHLAAAGYPPAECRRITRGMFEHFATAFSEALVMRRTLSRETMERHVEWVNMHLLDEAVAAGRGAVMVGCHQGSWELGGVCMGLRGSPITTVARPFRNPYLDGYLNAALRTGTGQRVVHQEGALRSLLRDIRGGRVGILMADQNAGKGGVFVPFFGRPASTWPTPALLALRTGAPLLPFFTARLGPYRYAFGFHPDPPPPRTGDLEADVAAHTAWYTALFERSIRERPEQWLWAHRRWRSREKRPAGPPVKNA